MNYLLLENYIKNVLKENNINELYVFDFDMTLYNHETESWIEETISHLEKGLQSPNIRVILCTARSNKEEHISSTEKLLNQRNLSLENFDHCYFKSISRKEKTPEYKSNVILDEITANESIVKVKFWDDRDDTLDRVKEDIRKYNIDIEYIAVKC